MEKRKKSIRHAFEHQMLREYHPIDEYLDMTVPGGMT